MIVLNRSGEFPNIEYSAIFIKIFLGSFRTSPNCSAGSSLYAPVRSKLKYYAACVHYLHIILSDKENNFVSLFEAETVEVWQESQSSLG